MTWGTRLYHILSIKDQYRNRLLPDLPPEAIHGQRYILYAKNKKVFLVGDTLTALKKLSN